MVVIVKQPGVNVAIAEYRLNGGEVHEEIHSIQREPIRRVVLCTALQLATNPSIASCARADRSKICRARPRSGRPRGICLQALRWKSGHLWPRQPSKTQAGFSPGNRIRKGAAWQASAVHRKSM